MSTNFPPLWNGWTYCALPLSHHHISASPPPPRFRICIPSTGYAISLRPVSSFVCLFLVSRVSRPHSLVFELSISCRISCLSRLSLSPMPHSSLVVSRWLRRMSLSPCPCLSSLLVSPMSVAGRSSVVRGAIVSATAHQCWDTPPSSNGDLTPLSLIVESHDHPL